VKNYLIFYPNPNILKRTNPGNDKSGCRNERPCDKLQGIIKLKTVIIHNIFRRRKLRNIAWDVWRASRSTPAAVGARQQRRLVHLIEFARVHSPLYQQLYKHLPSRTGHLQSLPPVTKPELMENFNNWVTDRAVTKLEVEAFVANKNLAGRLHQDKYAVWTSSGVTGEPGIVLHDGYALSVYGALMVVRGLLAWMTPSNLFAALLRGGRQALVLATGGHFAGAAFFELASTLNSSLYRRSRTFSVLKPLSELVPALNDFNPTVLVSYPNVLTLLAAEQIAGRLNIDPILIATAGEWLAPPVRNKITSAFSCPVRDCYAASEFMGIAFDCVHGRLHVNSDWVILEPVDESFRPVPPEHVAHSTLLTNLANRVQPIIRYNLGDSIIVNPEPCPCLSPLPCIQIEGRCDDILTCNAPGRETVRLLPLALATVVEETPGVRRFQIIQIAPAKLSVRLEVFPDADNARVWEKMTHRLQGFLKMQGLSWVAVEKAREPPRRDPVSGKFRQVWSYL